MVRSRECRSCRCRCPCRALRYRNGTRIDSSRSDPIWRQSLSIHRVFCHFACGTWSPILRVLWNWVAFSHPMKLCNRKFEVRILAKLQCYHCTHLTATTVPGLKLTKFNCDVFPSRYEMRSNTFDSFNVMCSLMINSYSSNPFMTLASFTKCDGRSNGLPEPLHETMQFYQKIDFISKFEMSLLVRELSLQNNFVQWTFESQWSYTSWSSIRLWVAETSVRN